MAPITDKDRAEFREVFGLFDQGGKGEIDSRNLGMVMRSAGYNPTEKEIQTAVSQHGGGTINFDAFINILSSTSNKNETEEELREAFRVFDKDNSGYISAAELKYIMTNLGEKQTEEEVNLMIKEVGVDSDGMVNYENLVSIMMRKI